MARDLVLDLGHTVTVDGDLHGAEALSIYISDCGVDSDEEEVWIDKVNAEKLISHLMSVFEIVETKRSWATTKPEHPGWYWVRRAGFPWPMWVQEVTDIETPVDGYEWCEVERPPRKMEGV